MTDPDALTTRYAAIAAEFLQSALIVDDQALYPRHAVERGRVSEERHRGGSRHADVESGSMSDEARPTSSETDSGAPKEPESTRRGAVGGLRPPGRGEGEGVTGTLVRKEDDFGELHDLDAHRAIDAFARHGIVCGILSPQKGDPEEKVLRALLPAALNSDLLITDWVQHKDNGEATVRLLREVLKGDRQRQRVIAIYTGEPALDAVAEEVASMLEQELPEDRLEREPGGMVMSTGPARVVVLNKEGVEVPPGKENRIVSIEHLPERLIREFAEGTVGLVRGTALAALAAIRSDTHRLLNRLHERLDAAYLGHRIAQPSPPDAEEHLTRAIVDEISAIIAEHRVGGNASAEASEEYLDHVAPTGDSEAGYGKLIDPNKTPLSRDQVAQLLRTGLGDDRIREAYEFGRGIGPKHLTKVKSQSTLLVTGDGEAARAADAAFAELLTLETPYLDPDRFLRLGTIVACGDEMLLCVMPLCDSVRLSATTRFPFVPLKIARAGAKAELMIPRADGTTPARVGIVVKPANLVQFDLEPGADGTVRPLAGEEPCYEAVAVVAPAQQGGSAGPTVLRWLAQLKRDHAQRVAVRVGHEFARVGVDEPEILRLGGV